MNNSRIILSGLVLIIILASYAVSPACTSFMLETDQGLYFVHSLNQGNVAGVPGLIFINRRDEWKHGYSWDALVDVNHSSGPGLIWKSKFGSVTFNPFGKEFPDGGMNEVGLYIWEMSFDTEYPNDENKPKLFQCQWMQYVLDNFSTVEDVIENAGRMNIDGWGWHYFIADKSGKTAIIDFVGGKPIVYKGETMPVPICCNSNYPDAIKWLEQHEGFGGELEIEKIEEEIPRFIYGAKLMREFDSHDPVDYSFYMLDEMSKNVRWSVVFDVSNSTVYFKTNLNQDVKHFSFSSNDFAIDNGPLVLDIECPGKGNIRDQFTTYNNEVNRKLLSDVFGVLCDAAPVFQQTLLDDQGVSLDGFTDAFMSKVKSSENYSGYAIHGEWEGSAAYPTSEGLTEFPMTLVISEEDGQYQGTVNDDQIIVNLPITNTAFLGGLLRFTIKHPETRDILYYQLYVCADEIKGYIEFDNEKRKGAVSLRR